MEAFLISMIIAATPVLLAGLGELVADAPAPVPPCGGCRQKLAEFAGPDVRVTMATVAGAETVTTVGDLLPGAFGRAHME